MDGINNGSVNVYEYDGINWIQLGQTIFGENDQDLFGTSVSLNGYGDIITIGSPSSDAIVTNSKVGVVKHTNLIIIFGS